MTKQDISEPAPQVRPGDAAPQCLQVGDTPVRLFFQPDGGSLEQKLRTCFLRLKS